MTRSKGHTILAKMGKRVLRPGGRELTLKLLENLEIGSDDHVVEFGPGRGFTANIVLKLQPASYIGIERDEKAADRLREKLKDNGRNIVIGNAAHSSVPSGSADKVFGEAILTMQATHRKAEIIAEAARILKKGGLYGIHELGLTPVDISTKRKAQIQRELAKSAKVNVRPLTVYEWSQLLEDEGFEVIGTEFNPMHLLKPRRLIEDEGFLGASRVMFNLLTHKPERKQIKRMYHAFKEQQRYLNAIAMITRKK